MAINYTQTGTNFTNGTNAGCSGASNSAGTLVQKQATDGGSAGGATSPSLTSSQTGVWGVEFKCIIGSTTSWNSGNWTWRLNVTTANMNLTLDAVYICRIDSGDINQATIGSATALGVSLGTTGVKSGTISGSAQTPSVGDYVLIVFVFSNGAMSTQSFGLTCDQNIDSPFTAITFIPSAPKIIKQSINRSYTY